MFYLLLYLCIYYFLLLKGCESVKTCLRLEAEEALHTSTGHDSMESWRGQASQRCAPVPSVCWSPLFRTKEARTLHQNSKCTINTFRMKTQQYLFPRGNKPLLYHQIGNKYFFIFITNP